jgi:hypothetical protein
VRADVPSDRREEAAANGQHAAEGKHEREEGEEERENF